jgi:hypothetical protein
MVKFLEKKRFKASKSSLDIQFWRTRKSLEGLSVRSIFFHIFQSFIVLLYVFDNDTNTMVRISVFIGIIIELWKLPKVLSFEVCPSSHHFSLSFSFNSSVFPMKHGLV